MLFELYTSTKDGDNVAQGTKCIESFESPHLNDTLNRYSNSVGICYNSFVGGRKNDTVQPQMITV
eukprot:5565224-Amphidinium_carterae.1